MVHTTEYTQAQEVGLPGEEAVSEQEHQNPEAQGLQEGSTAAETQQHCQVGSIQRS